jgi:hypothetical protein
MEREKVHYHSKLDGETVIIAEQVETEYDGVVWVADAYHLHDEEDPITVSDWSWTTKEEAILVIKRMLDKGDRFYDGEYDVESDAELPVFEPIITKEKPKKVSLLSMYLNR